MLYIQKYSMTDEQICRLILNCAFKVHTKLWPWLLESSYRECLCYEIKKLWLFLEKEKPLPLVYEEVKLEIWYRIDILVEKSVVIELKTVEAFTDVHIAQTLTYMKFTGCKLWLLLNFYVKSMKDGIRRLVL